MTVFNQTGWDDTNALITIKAERLADGQIRFAVSDWDTSRNVLLPSTKAQALAAWIVEATTDPA